MTPATLFREGPDLDALLAELDAEHPGRVQVVDVEYGRDGGVLGFFAHRRVGVHYRLSESSPPLRPAPDATLDDLLAAADAGDGAGDGDGVPASAPDESKLEFARMLLELASAKAAERRGAPAVPAPRPQPPRATRPRPPAPVPTAVPVPAPAVVPAPVAAPVALPAPPSAPPPAPAAAPASVPAPAYALRRRLVEVGVPIEWIPDGADNTYQAVEQLVRRVPLPARADLAAGQVIVVAGPGAAALDAARALATRLRLGPAGVHAVGCGASVPAKRRVEAWNAAAFAGSCRAAAAAPVVVAVSLDDAASVQVVRALAPDRLHLVVDARGKSGDARRTIDALGPVHSVFVTGAARTASPASVWELGVPIETLDGRPATRGTWAAMLIDALDALDEA